MLRMNSSKCLEVPEADRHVDQNNSEFGQKNGNNEIWS